MSTSSPGAIVERRLETSPLSVRLKLSVYSSVKATVGRMMNVCTGPTVEAVGVGSTTTGADGMLDGGGVRGLTMGGVTSPGNWAAATPGTRVTSARSSRARAATIRGLNLSRHSGGAAVLQAGLLNVLLDVLLQLVLQASQADPEQPRRLGTIAVHLLEGVQDVAAFDFAQGQAGLIDAGGPGCRRHAGDVPGKEVA